jgi:ATP-binding cassette, subfamily B (MDR/TAP), member 1
MRAPFCLGVSPLFDFSSQTHFLTTQSVPQINLSRDAAARLLRLSNLPLGASHEHLGKVRVFSPAPVRFTNLNFSYPSRPEESVLRSFSLTIPANSCTVIVGPSGSGKSTISSLLLRLYSPPLCENIFPTITLGGFDIQDLHIPTIRSLVSLVPQQPRLLADSVRNNMSYGLDPFSPLNAFQNIQTAAQAAGIDEFICTLPYGYSTIVGEGGIGLSGGQAQRLAIARALVRQPRILILDEATSCLDPEGTEIIRCSVRRLLRARRDLTVIMITHATEMMEIADKVVVVERGSVVEEGPYHVLAGRPGGRLQTMLTAGELTATNPSSVK